MRAWKDETFGSEITMSLLRWRPMVYASRVRGKDVSPSPVTSTRREDTTCLRLDMYGPALGETISLVSSPSALGGRVPPSWNCTDTPEAAGAVTALPSWNLLVEMPPAAAAGTGVSSSGGFTTATNLAFTRWCRIWSVASSSALPARRQISLKLRR